MKNFTKMKFAALLVMSLMVMVGCNKEQSSISPEDMPKTAKIVGSYCYDEGQDYVGGDYVRLIKPAANVEVEVTIDAADMDVDNDADGVLTYKVVTDAEGHFELTLKIPDAGATAHVKPADFTGKHYSIVGVDEGEPIYKELEVVYTAEEQDLELTPNAIVINDVLFTHKERDLDIYYPEVSEFLVVVGEATYSKGTNEDGQDEVRREYKGVEEVDVIIEVTYDDRTLKYVACTDDDGIATFNIPAKEKNWSANISVSVIPYVVDTFTYFKREYDSENGEDVVKRYNITGGIFEQIDFIDKEFSFDDVEGRPAPECRVRMAFEAFNGEETYGYEDEVFDWNNINF